MRKSFSTLIAQFTVHKNEALAKQADQIAASSRFQNLIIMLIGVATVVYFAIQGYLLTRSIRPLNRMSDQLLKIAEGGGTWLPDYRLTRKTKSGM